MKATRSTAVASGEECLEADRDSASFDLMLLDVWLQKIDGLETLARIQARDDGAHGGDDFRARKHRDGGARDEAGRLRLRREAAFPRKNHSGGAQRAGIHRAWRKKTAGCARNWKSGTKFWAAACR